MIWFLYQLVVFYDIKLVFFTSRIHHTSTALYGTGQFTHITGSVRGRKTEKKKRNSRAPKTRLPSSCSGILMLVRRSQCDFKKRSSYRNSMCCQNGTVLLMDSNYELAIPLNACMHAQSLFYGQMISSGSKPVTLFAANVNIY